MVNYILKLELNFGNKMIFAVQNQSRDIALILLEDCHRAGELMRDFSFLHPNYYETEDEWDDSRNLISVIILSLSAETMDQEMQDDLVCLADSMVEYKPAVNTKIQFCYDPKACRYYSERSEKRMQFTQYLLSLCENNESANFDDKAFNHLTQL